MAGQTVTDRLLAARHSLAGQGLAKSVCKATTEEMIGPKKKHLDYLLHCTNEPNVSIPQMANLLIERSQHANWIVVFKALITVHHLLCYGNERFMQYLASSNCTFQLSSFLDKSGVQGVRVGYDMSPFIRRYAKYLNEKALAYRTVAFDFCKVKRGKEDGTLRTMNADKLLKTVPVLQSQVDALLEFDCTANELTNGVINMAFMLLFRDLIRLFACYNDGIINMLEKYFDMNKKQCREALDLYKKFLIRMDRVAEFLKVAENVGIDKGDIPDLTKAPSSLLDALEQHLASLEGRKGSAANTPTQTASNIVSAVTALSSTSQAFGTAAQHNGIDENLKRQALAEEEAAMNQYKELAKSGSPTSAPSTNPFLSSPTNNSQPQVQQGQPILDLFGSPPVSASPIPGSQSGRASDDLLQLAGNPFADMFAATGQATHSAPPVPAPPVMGSNANMWGMSNGFGTAQPPTSAPSSGAFVSDKSFSSVFGGNTSNAGGDVFGDVLQPVPSANTNANTMMMGAPPAAPMQTVAPGTPAQKVLTGDLDSSLASLAQNLAINKGAQPTKGVQWSSPKNAAKTGGMSWVPQPMAATTGVGYRPMGQGMPAMNVGGQFPPMQSMGMAGMRPMAPVGGPAMGAPGMMTGGGVTGTVPPPGGQAAQLDPFGTL